MARNRLRQTDREDPYVSVIVPVYEDPEGIVTTLRTLAAQTYPTDRHEVIVVDNGSSDSTRDIASAFAEACSQIRLIVEPEGGSYTARNAGIEAARGSVLSFIDADMWVDPDWLESLIERLVDTDAKYLACDVEVAGPSGDQSLAERYNRRTAFPIREYVEEWEFAPTCCLTVRREVVADVGPFDDRLVSSGDREFGNRVAEAGYDFEFTDVVAVTHPPRTTTSALVGKAVRIGRGKYQVRKYYPERYGRPFTLLINPAQYTPALPQTMAKHVRGWDDVPGHRKLAFALLAWILTLAKTVGIWREALAQRDRSNPVSRSSGAETE